MEKENSELKTIAFVDPHIFQCSESTTRETFTTKIVDDRILQSSEIDGVIRNA
jgi:hypothetical protein